MLGVLVSNSVGSTGRHSAGGGHDCRPPCRRSGNWRGSRSPDGHIQLAPQLARIVGNDGVQAAQAGVSPCLEILGPPQPLQIVKENAGNAISRARSVLISIGVASLRWWEGHQRQQLVHADAQSGLPFLRLADPARTSWVP